jgi:DNA invertase Pin-like site-specific DNA recombinase
VPQQQKRAFSYVRFSKLVQCRGDSLRRQAEWSAALAERSGWVLDDELSVRDLGVSGFRGRNAVRGGLAAFLEAIRQRRVKPGDVLIVESLDRLSRQAMDDAYDLFRGILKTGVEIHTREPDRHYTRKSLSDLVGVLEPLLIMSRAHEESETKSMRNREGWAESRRRARAENRPIHHHLPAWLRWSSKGKRSEFEVIPEAARTIELIYRLAGQGFGLDAILAKLQKDKTPPISRPRRHEDAATNTVVVLPPKWVRSYIAKLLRDRSLLGEYHPHVLSQGPVDPNDPNGPTRSKRTPQGEPIRDYFPAVLTEDEFLAARNAVEGRRS